MWVRVDRFELLLDLVRELCLVRRLRREARLIRVRFGVRVGVRVKVRVRARQD